MRRNVMALTLSMLFFLWTLATPFCVAEDLADAPQAEAAQAEATEDATEQIDVNEEEEAAPDDAENDEPGQDGDEVASLPVDEPWEAEELDLTADEEDEIDLPEDAPVQLDETEASLAYVDGADIPEMLVACPTLGLENDEAISGFIEQQLYAGMPSGQMPLLAAGGTAGSRLAANSPERRLYDILCPLIRQVAEGTLTSTAFAVPMRDIYDDVSYTAADLGVETLLDGEAVSAQAQAAFKQRVTLSLSQVLNALMVDMPYEMFWYDKTRGTVYYALTAVCEDGALRLRNYETGTLTYNFRVAAEYSANGGIDTYEVDGDRIASIQTAADNARQIVDRYAGLGDIDKLRAYRDTICDLVSYNYSAAKGGVSYGNPWQLVWVFDGIEETNVVCEGYAKAFQYLCEMSAFDGDVSVVSAFGKMNNEAGGGGDHMWNVVTLGGENYLADLTNCDSGTVGYPDKLFLVGYTDRQDAASLEAGYIYDFELGKRTLSYAYDDKFVRLFSRDDLAISDRAAGPTGAAAHYGKANGLEWALTSAGTLYIDGTGTTPDYTPEAPAPWCAEELRGLVARVFLGDGVTGLGDRAFYGCQNLTQIRLSTSVERFGEDVFTGCGMYADGAKGIIIQSCANAAAVVYARALMEGEVARYSVTHAFVEDAAVAPTCTGTGLTEGSHCAVCGEVRVARQVVPATGHTPVSVAAVATTAAREGLTEGSKCAVCNAVLVAQKVVPRLTTASSATTTSGTQTGGSDTVVPDASAPETQASVPAPDYSFHVTKNASKSVQKGTPLQIVVDGKAVKSYKSSNKKVASVSKDGWVTAKKAGTAKITVTLKNKKKLTVKLKVTDPYLPKSVKLAQGKKATVKVGQTLALSAAMSPTTAVSTLKWKSGNKKIATVTQQGVVKAKKAGRVKITVTTANKKKATITIRVVK